MASEGNEWFTRHLFLLAFGGRHAVIGILNREVNSRSQPLDFILSDNRSRFSNFLPPNQLLQLFPTEIRVNDDIATWDLLLLISVVMELFQTSMSSRERSALNTLMCLRKKIKKRPNEICLLKADYDVRRVDLKDALTDLIDGLEHDTRKEVEKDISGATNFTIGTVFDQIQKLREFPEDHLNPLRERFQEEYPGYRVKRTGHRFDKFIGSNNDAPSDESSPKQEKDNIAESWILIPSEEKESTYTADDTNRSWFLVPSNENGSNDTEGEQTVVKEIASLDEVGPANVTGSERVVSEQAPLNDIGTSNVTDELIPAVDVTPTREQRVVSTPPEETPRDGIIFPYIAEGDDTTYPPNSGHDQIRLNNVIERLHELSNLTSGVHNRSGFWQELILKIRVNGDSPIHTADATASIVMVVNKIITHVDLLSVVRSFETPQESPITFKSDESIENRFAIDDNEGNENLLAIEDNEGNNESFPSTGETENNPSHHSRALIPLSRNSPQERNANTLRPTKSMFQVRQRRERDIEQQVLDKLREDDQIALMESVVPILLDVLRSGGITMSAGEGSVLFEIRCTSYSGLSNLVKFIKSNRLQSLLNNIAFVLERQTRHRVKLSPLIPEDCLQHLERFIDEELVTIPKTGSVYLKLKHVGFFFFQKCNEYQQSEKAKDDLKRVAEALAKRHGGSYKISIDFEQHTRALEKHNRECGITGTGRQTGIAF